MFGFILSQIVHLILFFLQDLKEKNKKNKNNKNIFFYYMSTIFTGSNYGVISILNSGSGTLTNIGDSFSFSYENIQNYVSTIVNINLTGSGFATLKIYNSIDGNDFNSTTEIIKLVKIGFQVIPLIPLSKFIKLEIIANDNNITYNIQTKYNNTTVLNDINGVISSMNSFFINSPISINSVINGEYEDVSNYSLITFQINANTIFGTGILEAIFSTTTSSEDRIITYTIQDLTANGLGTNSLTFNPPHTLIPISKYFKIRFTNGNYELNSLNLETFYHKKTNKTIPSIITNFLSDYFDVENTRSIINGRTDGTILPGGRYENITSYNSALSVRVKEPLTAFGEIMTANLYPFVQIEFSSGRPLQTLLTYQNDPSNTSYNFQNSLATISASSTNSSIKIFANEFIKYKSGQGIDNRISGVFITGYKANADQFIGVFNSGDSYCFGYFDGTEEFAIRHQKQGKSQTILLTITGTATTSNTIVLNFDNTNINIPISINNNAVLIANEIVKKINVETKLNTYGWTSSYNSEDSNLFVYLTFNRSQDTQIVLSISGVPSGITISQSTLIVGKSPITTIIPQSSWNISTCKDMGSLEQNYLKNSSGFILDPSKGNVYKISYQYLGFGNITFFIENPENELIIPVHRIKYANNQTSTNVGNPNLRIGIGIDSYSNSDSITLSTGSMASFLQGNFITSPIISSYANTIIANSASFSNFTRTQPCVIFGINGIQIFESLNSNSTKNYVVNEINLLFDSINFTVNPTQNNVTTNIKCQLVKNNNINDLIVLPNTNIAPNFIKNNSGLIDFINGTSTTTNTEYTRINNATILFETTLLENNSFIYNLKNLNIFMTRDDTFYLTFYGTSSSNVSISASISYNINM